MIKKCLLVLSIFFTALSSQAYQDCVIFNDGKLTDINIEDNTIIDVSPIVTIMNEKNTLIVHPLKSGKTRFCALRNNKNLELFEVTIDEYSTNINAPQGFEVLTIDSPFNEFEFELDKPPVKNYEITK